MPNTMMCVRRAAVLLLTSFLLALTGVAQQAPNKQPGSNTQEDRGGTTVIVPVLKGLVFLDSSADLEKNGLARQGLDTSKVKLLDTAEFRNLLSSNLESEITLDGLNRITRSVVTFYREHHHPLVDVSVPAQNVNSGVIQVVVTEFRVGSVRVEGNRWFSNSIVAAPISLQHGDQVDSSLLINQLDAANTNPFRRVNLVYEPSSDKGYTDVVLRTQDRFPVRVFSGFDNSGTPVTTRSRWELGATWGNALWHDQQLAYQFSSSDDFFTGRSSPLGQAHGASFIGNSLTWSMPIRGRDSISVSGSYQRSIPNIGVDFGLVGRSGQASGRYNLALRRTQSLTHALQFGYDFKTTNNNLNFGGTLVQRTNSEIDQFPVSYTANLTDKWGATSLTSSLVFSPGSITPNNNDVAFQPATAQAGRDLASARYVYWHTDVNRLSKLPQGCVWSLRVITQTSTANLLYTEQLAAGGPEILRGYDPYSILGDRGVVLSNELRSPALSKQGEFQLGQLQILGFWDFAHVGSVHDMAGDINHLNASSAGFGARYNLRSNMTGRFDYGWQLQHLPTANDRNQLANFAFIVSY